MVVEEENKASQRLRRLVISTNADKCVACGACAAGCPIADWSEERLDPRRMVRLVQYGIGHVLTENDWIWHCTACGKCTLNCPSGVDLGTLLQEARGLIAKDASPGGIQKTANLHRTTSNNMGLTTEDWLETVGWMAEELSDDLPGFVLPIKRQGAEYFATINSKLPMYYPQDLQDIFKIFHVAGVSWTLPDNWWEGTNYAMFTNDLETWEETLRNQVAMVESLGCETMAYTECGHGYYATLLGYEKFGIKPKFKVVHVVNLYAQWIREGRFKLDPSRNGKKTTLHDPCNAVRKAGMKGFTTIDEDARYVLSKVTEDFVEMRPNREAGICCSGGGGALMAGFKKARSYYGQAKVDQIDRSSAELVCTPCVNCYDAVNNLASEYDRKWTPIHLWKLLANSIVT
jgi:Fe-S oxidoreductase